MSLDPGTKGDLFERDRSVVGLSKRFQLHGLPVRLGAKIEQLSDCGDVQREAVLQDRFDGLFASRLQRAAVRGLIAEFVERSDCLPVLRAHGDLAADGCADLTLTFQLGGALSPWSLKAISNASARSSTRSIGCLRDWLNRNLSIDRRSRER
ncbi:hypothetical protein [Bradyrhizobium macuxiense]|uniref:hypothetical protein n=1 Tax=Bradyrhizobium macuxiense TaxID=1755647 RepID=UPI0010A974A0|nr:hypothetical protein [Bradyrhizobium macuxiense]